MSSKNFNFFIFFCFFAQSVDLSLILNATKFRGTIRKQRYGLQVSSEFNIFFKMCRPIWTTYLKKFFVRLLR